MTVFKKEGIKIKNYFYCLMHFSKRVFRHLNYKFKYYGRKAQYKVFSKLGIDIKHIHQKRLANLPCQYILKVFLNRTLEDIDRQLRIDQNLCKQIVNEGNLALQNTWLVLNEHRKNMYDWEKEHYLWNVDFFTGYRYPDCFYQDVRKSKALPLTDIKVPWETSRMQSLFALALSYRATKEEKYVAKILDIIRDFSVCCPCGVGVNWNVSMEVGIRISNIILACELIQDSRLFDDIFRKELMLLGYEHMLHIRNNLENEHEAGNHYLADLLGLAAVSIAFPFLPGAENVRVYTEKSLHRELLRQILPDGGHFECTTSYHRLVGEMLCFTIIALQKRGFILTENEITRLKRMCGFTCALRMDNGLVPQLGDNDSGRIFQLAPENTRDHDSFINTLYYITNGRILFPARKDAFFCFYGDETQGYIKDAIQTNMAEFKDFGLLRYRDKYKYIVLCGMTPEKNSKPGHTHNDLLSFVLSVGEEEFITDPGSGEYTGNVETRNRLRSILSHSSVSIDENEQRLIPSQPKSVFQWQTSANAVLEKVDKENSCVVFNGKCSYERHDCKPLSHERKMTVSGAIIIVEDTVKGMGRQCSLSLPLSPGLKPEIVQGMVLVPGKEHVLKISGTWQFDVSESVFAVHYKRILPNYVILCKSRESNNKLSIEIMKI